MRREAALKGTNWIIASLRRYNPDQVLVVGTGSLSALAGAHSVSAFPADFTITGALSSVNARFSLGVKGGLFEVCKGESWRMV